MRCVDDTITRLAPLPLTLTPGAVDPSMVSVLLTTSCPDVSLMVAPARLGAKLITSPGWASRIAWRSEPGPLSLSLVTVMIDVLACCARLTSENGENANSEVIRSRPAIRKTQRHGQEPSASCVPLAIVEHDGSSCRTEPNGSFDLALIPKTPLPSRIHPPPPIVKSFWDLSGISRYLPCSERIKRWRGSLRHPTFQTPR